MISSVTIQNFKNLQNLQIGMEPLTVFVGANGCGKTSVLDALSLAVRAATTDPQKVFRAERDCDWLYTRGAKGGISITCKTSHGEFSVKASPPDGAVPAPDLLGGRPWTFNVTAPNGTILENAIDPARSLVFFHLSAAKLVKPCYSETIPPRFRHDGEGLTSVLAYMALNNPDGFGLVMTHMKSLIPKLKRIRFRKAVVRRTERQFIDLGKDSLERRTSREYQGDALVFDFDHADNVAAHTVSEGTILLLGLLTILLGPRQPKIVLLDDMEHGLHPQAQKLLLEALKQVMKKFSDLQIIATAHSPYLLDQLEPDQIRLMTTDEKGYAVCGRLAEHPQFEKWKDEMAPGELWSLFGEKWLSNREGDE
jgi:predicted ATPase